MNYKLLLTQRLILQPSFQMTISSNKIDPLEIGSGLNKTSFDLRFRYEIKREFAPYIGLSWNRYCGTTKALRKNDEDLSFLLGVKMWF